MQGMLSTSASALSPNAENIQITPLPADTTQALLARLEPLPGLSSQSPTPLRPGSAPPPRPGPVQAIAFLRPTGKAVANVPLVPQKKIVPLAAPEILPQGQVKAESEVRIRFAQPMVAVAAVGSAVTPRVIIAPAVSGTWRWIDTRVLVFSAHSHLPKATDFVVTVPAGIQAQSGAPLLVAAMGKFSTAPLRISSGFPKQPLRTDSPILIQFDQAIDAAQLRPFLYVYDSKGQALPYTTLELEAAQRLWSKNSRIQFEKKDFGRHSLILAPKSAWPAGKELRVLLKSGAPSSEGPLLSDKETDARFEVVAPFTVRGISCDDSDKPRYTQVRCAVNGLADLKFSNDIDPKSYHPSKVQLVGEKLADHRCHGNSVWLFVPDSVGRTYDIAIKDGLVDVFGQALEGNKRISLTSIPERNEPYFSSSEGLIVLDPRFEIPQWVITAQSVLSIRVQLYKVKPSDYFEYERYEQGQRITPPGQRILDKTYSVGQKQGADLRVDLRPALNQAGRGHVIAIASAVGPPRSASFRSKYVAWIQVTKLGIAARSDGEKVNAWISSISANQFLAPLAEVKTAILVEGQTHSAEQIQSDAFGHVSLPLLPAQQQPPKTPEPSALLVAQTETDSIFTAIRRYRKAIRKQNALWYVTDDRFTYKPGEKVYLKGWVRFTHDGVNPNLALPNPLAGVSYTLIDERGNQIGGGTAKLSNQGGFHIEVTLPENVNLGVAYFVLATEKLTHRHPIAIREFRTPAFSVALDNDVTHAGAAPLFLGESIQMNAMARYYSGGNLSGAHVHWTARLQNTTYKPPGWSDWNFDSEIHSRYKSQDDAQHPSTLDLSRTEAMSSAGTASMEFGVAALPRMHTSLLSVDVTVTDIDRMSIRASSPSIVVHKSAYYIGMRVRPGTDDVLEIIVTDVDGNAVSGVPVKVDFAGTLGSERYRADAKPIDVQHCEVKSRTESVTCRWQPKDALTAYTATAELVDFRGRPNQTQYAIDWFSFSRETKDLEVFSDRPQYRPGDIAKLEIRSKVFPAMAVVTFARQGIFAQKRIALTAESTFLDLPIEPAHVMNLHVQVDRLSKRQRLHKANAAPLPELSSTQLNIPVDLSGVRLDIRTRAKSALIAPGEDATFDVEVFHQQKPLADAEVALLVVDEAVLSVSGKDYADPLAPFYRKVDAGTSSLSTLGIVQDAGADLVGEPGFSRYRLDGFLRYASMIGYGSGGGAYGGSYSSRALRGAGSTSTIVAARKDFRPNAVFSPLLKTGADGKVTLSVKMPDSLTRFRIIALATAQTYLFGKAENLIVTQRKLNARTVAPRFLTQGDKFALPIVLQNLHAAPRTIDLAVRAANLIALGPIGKRVTLLGGQRAEVRFDFTTQQSGKALIQTIAASGDYADAANVELPVYTPATTESFATYGSVDELPQFETLAVPADLYPAVGGVEVELASTQLQSLSDAFSYLYAYPYECAEQRSGRMLATAAIKDILEAFAISGRPTPQQIAATRKRDIAVLATEQHADGGWGYFADLHSDPFVSMQVLSALAGQQSFENTTKLATAYVRKEADKLLSRLEKIVATPPAKRQDRDEHGYLVSLAATALFSLQTAQIKVDADAERLHSAALALDNYPVDAKARILSLLAKSENAKSIREKLLQDLISKTHETASAATVAAQYQEAERLLLVSSNKTSALVLDAFVRTAPEHSLVSKLARGVLDARRYGRWGSTQENLVVLQALRRYFDTYEKSTPNYIGKLWVGQAAYAEQPFLGRSLTTRHAQLDWSFLQPGSQHDLAVLKSGVGRMYYRIGITYAPKQIDLPPLDAGFVVRRVYSAVDEPSDVQATQSGYKIRLGAKVLVTLEVLNTAERYNVALVDPLPAGIEAIDESLATSERAVQHDFDTSWAHVNMRDNRSEAFALTLFQGSHHFSYTARAKTPGTFIAAPAKAEEMYNPETFGRTSGQTVVIE